MTTTLPALGTTTHVASVTYACTFGMTQVNNGLVAFLVPQPIQFTFNFETGTTQADPAVDLITVTYDSSWFDQTTQETNIKTALTSICGLIATLVGSTQAVIQASVTIERTWRINPDQIGSAAPVRIPAAPVIYAEAMAYP